MSLLVLHLDYIYLGKAHRQTYRQIGSVPDPGDRIRLYHSQSGEEATLDFIVGSKNGRLWEMSQTPHKDELPTECSITLGEPDLAQAE